MTRSPVLVFFQTWRTPSKSASTYEGAINSAWEGFVVDKLKARTMVLFHLIK